MGVKNLVKSNVLEIRNKNGIGEIGGNIDEILNINKNNNFVVVTAFNDDKTSNLYKTLKLDKDIVKYAHLITVHYEIYLNKNCQETYTDFYVIIPKINFNDFEKELQKVLKKHKQNSYIAKIGNEIILKDNDGNILNEFDELNKENFEKTITKKLEDNGEVNLKGVYKIKSKDNISSKRLFTLMGLR